MSHIPPLIELGDKTVRILCLLLIHGWGTQEQITCLLGAEATDPTIGLALTWLKDNHHVEERDRRRRPNTFHITREAHSRWGGQPAAIAWDDVKSKGDSTMVDATDFSLYPLTIPRDSRELGQVPKPDYALEDGFNVYTGYERSPTGDGGCPDHTPTRDTQCRKRDIEIVITYPY